MVRFRWSYDNIFYWLFLILKSLGTSGDIRRQGSWSTSAHVMACSLAAANHYLNPCWLIINEVLWHSCQRKMTRNSQDCYRWYGFKNGYFKITATSLRYQWVNKHINLVLQMHRHFDLQLYQWFLMPITGWNRVASNIEMMISKKPGIVWRILICGVTPVMLMVGRRCNG